MVIPGRDDASPARPGVPRWTGWLRRMPRGVKIALAAATALVALAAGMSIAVGTPGHATRGLPVAKNSPSRPSGAPARTCPWPTTPAARSS